MAAQQQPIVLRQDQVEAIDDIHWYLLAKGNRCILHRTCGGGKTEIMKGVAAQLDPPAQLMVVTVPTLQLADQWGHEVVDTFGAETALTMLASKTGMKGDVKLSDISFKVTTDVETIRARLKDLYEARQMHVVISTYNSLPKLARALKGIKRDVRIHLGLIDEAQWTAGLGAESYYQMIHDDREIPIANRIYATATPKVVEPPSPDPDRDPENEKDTSLTKTLGFARREYFSMDDVEVFGEVASRLEMPEAIEMGDIITDYRIHLFGVRKSDVNALRDDFTSQDPEAVEAVRALDDQEAAAALLLHHASARPDLDVRHIIAYHQYQDRASNASRAFDALPTASGHPFHDLYVDSRTSMKNRRTAFDEFQDRTTPRVNVLHNIAVVAEGVNLPHTTGEVLIDPPLSPGRINQMVGRMVRLDPSTPDKLPRLFVPIVFDDTQPDHRREGTRDNPKMDETSRTILYRILYAAKLVDEGVRDRVVIEPEALPEIAYRQWHENPATEPTIHGMMASYAGDALHNAFDRMMTSLQGVAPGNYLGVQWRERDRVWAAYVPDPEPVPAEEKRRGITHHPPLLDATFPTAREAAMAVDQVVLDHPEKLARWPLNFARDPRRLRRVPKDRSSRFMHVHWSKKRDHWLAQVPAEVRTVDGERKDVIITRSGFELEREAARAADALLHLYADGPVNFPEEEPDLALTLSDSYKSKTYPEATIRSDYHRGDWWAYTDIDGTVRSLGWHPTEEAALAAVEAAEREHRAAAEADSLVHVSRRSERGDWIAQVRVPVPDAEGGVRKVRVTRTGFSTATEAGRVADALRVRYGLDPTNFPFEQPDLAATLTGQSSDLQPGAPIEWDPRAGRWWAYGVDGDTIYGIGFFDDEEEALAATQGPLDAQARRLADQLRRADEAVRDATGPDLEVRAPKRA